MDIRVSSLPPRVAEVIYVTHQIWWTQLDPYCVQIKPSTLMNLYPSIAAHYRHKEILA